MGQRRVFRPPLPRDVSEGQFGTAWFWSKRFGLPTSRDCLETLARLVPPGFTGDRPQDKAWKYALSRGRLPKPRVIKAYTFFARAEQQRRAQRAKAAVLAAHLDYDRLGPQVAAWIDQYLQSNGTGPLWREVGAEFGWDGVHTHAIIKALHRIGWVSSTAQTRSLRAAQPEPHPLPCPRPNGAPPQTGSAEERPTGRPGCRSMPQAQRAHAVGRPGQRRP